MNSITYDPKKHENERVTKWLRWDFYKEWLEKEKQFLEDRKIKSYFAHHKGRVALFHKGFKPLSPHDFNKQ